MPQNKELKQEFIISQTKPNSANTVLCLMFNYELFWFKLKLKHTQHLFFFFLKINKEKKPRDAILNVIIFIKTSIY